MSKLNFTTTMGTDRNKTLVEMEISTDVARTILDGLCAGQFWQEMTTAEVTTTPYFCSISFYTTNEKADLLMKTVVQCTFGFDAIT